ncbi:hypothetical protein D3C77_613310 [compost metagenome]
MLWLPNSCYQECILHTAWPAPIMKICVFVDQAISYETKNGVDCVLYQEGITYFVWVLMGGDRAGERRPLRR